MEADRSPLTEQFQQSSGSYELVLSAVVLGLGGYFIDGWLGTRPVFMVGLTVLGFIGAGLSIYYRYKHQIATIQAETAALRSQASAQKGSAS